MPLERETAVSFSRIVSCRSYDEKWVRLIIVWFLLCGVRDDIQIDHSKKDVEQAKKPILVDDEVDKEEKEEFMAKSAHTRLLLEHVLCIWIS